ncbi:hypothetical protein ACTWPB_12595 [Nocardia sp. IBHARD005]|uniref:hypothetical protein n=1 Tax=Nocardia sp. IBHARD005 TaxID=3457765 RepID=UPI0040586292
MTSKVVRPRVLTATIGALLFGGAVVIMTVAADQQQEVLPPTNAVVEKHKSVNRKPISRSLEPSRVVPDAPADSDDLKHLGPNSVRRDPATPSSR